MNGEKRRLFHCFLIFVVILLLVFPVAASTYTYVHNESPGSVQDLVDRSENGDRILLSGGRYYENIIINKSIILGALETADPPEIVTRQGDSGIVLSAESAEIDGLTITGDARCGILILSGSNVIRNNSIFGLPCGIGLQSASRNLLTRNTLVNNSIGVKIERSSQENSLFLNYFDNQVDLVGQSEDITGDHIPFRYEYFGQEFTGPLGNYWTRYHGEDSRGDGTGDTPYILQQSRPSSGMTSPATVDIAPLMKPPQNYILIRQELPLGGIPTGDLPHANTLPRQGPGGMTFPPEPLPGIVAPFLWIIPIAVVLSIIAGILFERSRKVNARGSGDPIPRQPTGNETIVQKVDTVRRTGNPPPDDPYYTIRLPPALEQKYPGAEYRGEGGIGRVFKATNAEGHPVAIKVPIRFDELTGIHFTKELHLWQGLHHKNIAEIHSANIFPVPYIEIEYVGDSLAAVLTPLELKRAISIISGVAEGLLYAHEQGIIHRDIKPENILIDQDGTPKITDWGLAKAISDTRQTGLISFSLDFAAPEQLAPNMYGETGPWTDIYQLGVVFYSLLTGQVPFRGDGIGEVSRAILHDDPAPLPPDHPFHAELDAIIRKCLAKRPGDRYTSVSELLRDLTDIDRKT